MMMCNFSAIIRAGHIFAARKLKHIEISGAEHPILMFLGRNSNTNQEAIAKYFLIDKGAVAKSLAKLEEKGLVQRLINPQNHREKVILLSDRGKEHLKEMKEVLDEWNGLLFKDLSQEEMECFEAIVNKMAKNVAVITNKE
jgi:MarR family transcriptional regulator for hemolysin